MPPDDALKSTVTHKVPRVVAHRGRHDIHVENTLPAFRAAYASGCDMVEFDVQLSRDGIPVIFHDDDCRRLAGRLDRVFDLDWCELRELRLSTGKVGRSDKAGRSGKGGNSVRVLSDYRIPSLDEFLSEFGSKPFYLELKVPDEKNADAEYCVRLAAACADRVKAGTTHPETFLASFHLGILAFICKHGLFPKLGGIFEDFDRFRQGATGLGFAHAGLDLESISWDVFLKAFPQNPSPQDPNLDSPMNPDSGPSRDGYASESLRRIWIWDIDGEEIFRRAISMGVAGLVTDDVETLLRLLKTS